MNSVITNFIRNKSLNIETKYTEAYRMRMG